MNSTAWSHPVSPEQAARRAGGRRAYNQKRQRAAFYRRHEVWKVLFKEGKFLQKGIRLLLASQLGVSYQTICNDIKKLQEELSPCPQCGAPARLRHKV